MVDKPANLINSLATVMGQVGNIPKRGENKFHGYKYVMESDLVSEIRPLLAKAGIMIIPSVEKHEREILDDKGNIMTTLTVRFEITDGQSSQYSNIIGSGIDKGDKGAYKAMTGATKYLLMKLFLVDTGDDPEQDHEVDRSRATVKVPPKPPKPAPAKAGAVLSQKCALCGGNFSEESPGVLVDGEMRHISACPEPFVVATDVNGAQRGGYSEKATAAQIRLYLGRGGRASWSRADYLENVATVLQDDLTLSDDEEEGRKEFLDYLRTLSSEDMAQLVSSVPDHGQPE